VGAAAGAATVAPLPPWAVALVEAYLDGRVNHELTSAKPADVDTGFSAREGMAAAAGALPVTALQIARVRVGRRECIANRNDAWLERLAQ
jgi:hypothetical protein